MIEMPWPNRASTAFAAVVSRAVPESRPEGRALLQKALSQMVQFAQALRSAEYERDGACAERDVTALALC